MNLQSIGGRLFVGIGVVGVVCAVALMSRSGGAQSTTAPAAPVTAPSQQFLEFDMPGDTSGVTAFIVGYFAPGERGPAFSFEVPRARVESRKPGSMRIPLIVGPLPAGQTYTIRLRTVAGGRQSAWSAPSGSFTVPSNVTSEVGIPVPSAGRSAAARPRAARTALSELEKDPALVKRLSAEFPDLDLTKAAAGYRSVRDLAADLFAAGNLNVPFADLKKLTADAGNRNLERAIASLKPRANARAEARRARGQARTLLRGLGK